MHQLHLALLLALPICPALHGCAATETPEEAALRIEQEQEAAALRIAQEREVEDFNNGRNALLDSYQTGETTLQDMITDGWVTRNDVGTLEFADENPDHVRVLVMHSDPTSARLAISSGYLPVMNPGPGWSTPPGMLNASYSGGSGLSITHRALVAVSDLRGARLWSTAYELTFRDGVLVGKREAEDLLE